jgi:hypothetical protein
MRNLIVLLITSVVLFFTTHCTDRISKTEWSVNDQEYLETNGFNVLVFHNYYPVGKQGGIEFIHHDDRIATNGYIVLDLPSGQNFPRPEEAEREIDLENKTISAKVITSGFDLNYSIRVWPENGSVHLVVDLEKPIPSDLKDKVSFNLLLYPVAYRGKTYQLGDQFGVFPVEGLGPMAKQPDNDTENVPLATGSILMIAPEDPLYKIQFESLNGTLSLIDGRNTSLGGWFMIRSIIPEGIDKGAMEWIITPNLVSSWVRNPVIGISQVGYHPKQVKQAIIELDHRTREFETAELHRIKENGTIETLNSKIPERWGNFLRYTYGIYDFTEIREPGIYLIRYGQVISEPFCIDETIYMKRVWQPTLEIYFPVQMCHMRIRDRVRVWHGACHLDDALQAPVAIQHIDGYRSYALTETQYKPLTHVPNLNRGGWHDAGDNDLAAGSQAQTTYFLALADEAFGIEVDQTYVDKESLFVELRRPDGIPDLEQQIEHGVTNLLSGYRVSGHSFVGIVATREGRAFLGDVASLTDQLFYDASLAPDHKRGNFSGKPDDRWVFTNKDTSLEYEVITALAAASRVLRGYDDELAEECLLTAIRAWNYEQNHETVIQPNAYVPRNHEQQEILATTELYITTQQDQYKDRLIELQPVITENIDRVGWSVSRALTWMENENFTNEIRNALESYQSDLIKTLSENPYGVPWNPRIWGIGWSIQRYALEQYFLNQAYPELFDRENVLRVVNYVLGCHPGSNTSLVSGIGAHSLTVAYGFNMHWWSYIPGGMASGTALIRPDYPELKEPFPFLWQQTEYVMPGAASYIFCVLAADNLLNK